jgi:hypothetical protein
MRVDAALTLAALAAVSAAALLSGCGSAGSTAPAATPSPAVSAPAVSAPADPATICANQLTHWAGEELRAASDEGFDYQEMGLTGAQFAALGTLVEEARAQGPDLPPDWVADRARALCAEIAARPPSTGGSWPS